MAIDQELAASIHAMLKTVSPELDCYVLNMDLLRGHVTDDGSCLGWAETSMWFDLVIRDRMGDLYDGPRQLFALDLQAIREVAIPSPGNFERCVLNVALHEGAHLLPAMGVLESPDVPRVRELQVAAFTTSWKTPEPEPQSDYNPHDWRFARRCCHLYHRAIAAGFDVTDHRLLGCQGFGWQSPIEKYLAALGTECAEMAGETFATIEATEPPPPLGNCGATT